MAKFDLAVEKTLTIEGGFTNNPNDSGGATNYGITLGVMMGMGNNYDLDSDGDIDAEDVRLLTKDEAIGIYKKLYWNGDQLESQAVAEKNFDMAVNLGVINSAKLLQKAVLNLGYSIVVDGRLGPKSISLINSISESRLITTLCLLQETYYWNITKINVENKAESVYHWPANIIDTCLYAISNRDLVLCKTIVSQLKKLKLKQGNISFINGWITRANNRFNV